MRTPRQPCPFCGYRHTQNAATLRNCKPKHMVYCLRCGAHGPGRERIAEATLAWNGRSEPEAVSDLPPPVAEEKVAVPAKPPGTHNQRNAWRLADRRIPAARYLAEHGPTDGETLSDALGYGEGRFMDFYRTMKCGWFELTGKGYALTAAGRAALDAVGPAKVE